jgi:hypothetical protein
MKDIFIGVILYQDQGVKVQFLRLCNNDVKTCLVTGTTLDIALPIKHETDPSTASDC